MKASSILWGWPFTDEYRAEVIKEEMGLKETDSVIVETKQTEELFSVCFKVTFDMPCK